MGVWFLLAGLCVAATLWPVDGLTAERALALAEPWRLWTGPLRHADAGHMLRDLSGFVPLVLLLRDRLTPRRTAALLALGLPLPVLATFAGDAGAGGYYGVSGLVHALGALALLYLGRRRPGWGLVLAAALAAKLAFELSTGALWMPLSGGRPAVWGHAAGVALGLGVGGFTLAGRRRAPSAAEEQPAASDPVPDLTGPLEVLSQRDAELLARRAGHA